MTLDELHKNYVAELRESKAQADSWWQQLNERAMASAEAQKPLELWPAGPASHPWIIATYRKYFFLCVELNRQASHSEHEAPAVSSFDENAWGETKSTPGKRIEPKVFVYEFLAEDKTRDLYDFLSALVFVPIGVKADEPV